MKTLILNSSNVVQGSNNSTYTLNFKTNISFIEGDTIGVQSILIPYSWFNISSQYNNNSFGYTIDGFNFTINIPDGFYTYIDLNILLQTAFISNGHYLKDKDGEYVFYGSFTQNANNYRMEYNAFPIPLVLPTGYSNPAGVLYNGAYVPVSGSLYMPRLIIYSNNFGSLMGFTAGTFPNIDYQYAFTSLGQNTPNFSPVNTVLMRCNLVNNKYTNPSDLFFAFSNSDTKFGSNIVINNSAIGWIDVQPGNYQQITIYLCDQNFNPINFKDNNLCIQLLIKSKGE